jgi:hypothetical protein
MRGIERALLGCVVVVMSGCFNPRFACSTDIQCQSTELGSGRCEPNGTCSFPDASCPSGSRYGDPPYGNGDCVLPGQPPIDAALMEPMPDARQCFGGPFLTVCLQSPPTAPLTLSTLMPIDTDGSGCATIDAANSTDGTTSYCVLTGTAISVPAAMAVRASGTRPLVLVASDAISIDGTLDVGSHRTIALAGAGFHPETCDPGTLPGATGGGAGGTFIGRGGAGSSGTGGGVGGVAATPASPPLILRGGCPGQNGVGTNPAAGGRGGGAVYLIARNSILVGNDGVINAAGEGGGGGLSAGVGGGGGGSGGMIGFDAPTITNHGLVLANGGGGGEGSDNQVQGAPGAEPTSTAAAAGGATVGGSGAGGNGGAGSARTNVAGGVGGGVGAGSTQTGGGGGGGGAGLIKSAADLGAMTSPPSSP